jgi:predicted ribosome quality control (RQC) complex YloA/Tae2 family protein
MANSHAIPAGSDGVDLEDIVGGEGVVHIELDPALSAVRNAERYYDKARRTRLAREHALERLEDVEAERDRLRVVSDALAAVRSLDELDVVEETHASVIDGLQRGDDASDAVPYRRFALDGGYEVWVGRNARQNDQLTLHDSRKYDLWLHARGVAGSHTVLRVKGRTDRPPRAVIEQAAAIAAYFSKARTSSMAPVMMTERKYVRKPRKAAAGAVVVEREEVVMIEPGLQGKAF